MRNNYGQTDILRQYLSSQPQQHHTGLGTALRLAGAGLAAYGQDRKQKADKTALADALRGFNVPAMKDESGAMGPTIAAANNAPIADPEGMAAMLSNPATAPLAQALLGKALKEPEKPQYMEVGGNLVQISPGGSVSEAYRAPAKPGQGFSLSPGQTRYDANGKPIAESAPEEDDRYMTVPGVGVYDRQTGAYVGQQAQRPTGALPAPSGSPSNNLPPKAAQDVEVATIKEANKALAAEEAALEDQRRLVADLNRFEELLKVQDTGGFLRKLPGAGALEGAIDPQISEMRALTDRLTPQMRQGMPGAASDRDVQIFRSATVSPDKDAQVNRNIITGYKAQVENGEARLSFRQEYLTQNGTLSGADEAWQGYIEANPIFDPESSPEAPRINTNRRSWREHFTGAQEPRSSEPPTAKRMRFNAATGKLEPVE